MSWTALWQRLRQRFGILFTIGAALSLASIVSSIQFIIDAWSFVLARVDDVPIAEQVARLLGAVAGAILNWWRDVLRTAFGWFGLNLPGWLIDFSSAASFVIGRGVARWIDLTDRVNESRALSRRANVTKNVAKMALTVMPGGAGGALGALTEAKRAAIERDAIKARASYEVRRRKLPLEVTLTVLALAGFFAALFAIDAWYRSL